MHPCALESLRPFDVVLLIEAGFQLDQSGNLFSLLAGLAQNFGDFRLLPGAVQTNLDCQHVRIVSGGADEVGHHGVIRIRVVQQNIATLDHFKD